MTDTEKNVFIRRFIPCPRSIQIDATSTRRMSMEQLSFDITNCPAADSRIKQIARTMGAFATPSGASSAQDTNAPRQERVEVRFLLDGTSELPESDESYRIDTRQIDDGSWCFDVTARGIDGLVRATHTIRQLFLLPPIVSPAIVTTDRSANNDGDAPIELPMITIVDYPAIGERGQWGGNARDEIPWTAQWKMNLIEESARVHYVDDEYRYGLTQVFIDTCHSNGVKVVPYIPHLEQIAKIAGLLERKDITSTPDPSKPLPPEYVPGLCMSSDETRELIEKWLSSLACYNHVSSIEVWLSEGPAPCYCPKCIGTDPFVLEMRCIQRAFKAVKQNHPGAKLRILLTQGSYAVNDLVLEEAEPDVEIVYYDGGRTYDSSHTPMIYPLLESFSRSGGWLGVYPQVTHCWRTVFPFTGPQLISARGREFADKQLENVVGYAVPSNRHHAFNVAALAEWSWNPGGRSPYEFSAAYATIHGFPDPDAFASWAEAAGEAGWWLAESRMLLRLCYDYRFFEKPISTDEDHRFEFAGFKYDRDTIVEALETARVSLRLAELTHIEWTRYESLACTAGLEALLCIDAIVPILATGEALDEEQKKRAEAILEELDRSAATVSHAVSEWGEAVNRELNGDASFSCMMRMRDTANVLLRFCDALRQHRAMNELKDNNATYREKPLTTWSRANFDENHIAAYEFDVTSYAATSPGTYFLCLTHTGGNCGGRLTSLAVVEVSDSGLRTTKTESIDAKTYVGKWESWHDVKIDIPKAEAGCTYVLRFTMEVDLLATVDESTWDYTGTIGLRRATPVAP